MPEATIETKTYILKRNGFPDLKIRHYRGEEWQWVRTKDQYGERWAKMPSHHTDENIRKQIYESYLDEAEKLMDSTEPDDLIRLNEIVDYIVDYENTHYPIGEVKND